MRKESQGFSLIELLIVVAIILIIAAIAIPNLLKSRIAANHAAAVYALHAINVGEITYASTYNTGFSQTLAALGPSASGASTASAAGVIDSVLAAGVRQGYSFVYVTSADSAGRYDAYTLNANPLTVGTTGINYYYTDQTGTVRQNSTQQASAQDSPIGG